MHLADPARQRGRGIRKTEIVDDALDAAGPTFPTFQGLMTGNDTQDMLFFYYVVVCLGQLSVEMCRV